MMRLLLLLPLMLGLETWAFVVYRHHPLGRPAWFPVLTLLIQFLMVWSGLEAARWLLRRSSVSALKGPFEDHDRLWVWLGPFGGLWLGLACLAGGWLADSSWGPLAGFLLVAHFSGGALLWCLAAAAVLPRLMTDPDTTSRDWVLTALGLFSHLAGFAAYALVFPAARTPFRLAIHPALYLAATVLIFCYLTFYVYCAALSWAPLLALFKKPEE